jgi:predicted nuclease of predicted toxin-antitoxin system
VKLLLDQGLPAEASAIFRSLGYECSHVPERGIHRASGEDIATAAAAEGSVVITLDADFHALVAVRRLQFPSIIRPRREGCRAEEVVRIPQPVLFRYEAQLRNGCLISVKERQTSIRSLPIEL